MLDDVCKMLCKKKGLCTFLSVLEHVEVWVKLFLRFFMQSTFALSLFVHYITSFP